MIPDSLMIERARHRVESGAQLVHEQTVLVAGLRANGYPCNRAEDFLQLLQRAQSAFREDLEFLRRNLGGLHG